MYRVQHKSGVWFFKFFVCVINFDNIVLNLNYFLYLLFINYYIFYLLILLVVIIVVVVNELLYYKPGAFF